MSEKSISLHPEFGVNPSICVCHWCGKPNGEIALMGYNKGKEAPRQIILSYEPCGKCRTSMELGIAFIEAQEHPVESGQREIAKGLYPTGRWFVFKRESLSKILKEDSETYKNAMKRGKLFVDSETFDMIAGQRATDALLNAEVQGHA